MIQFNPFTIGPDHDDHSNSTAIIKLEESGQVFCPLCLSSSYKQIEGIQDDLFERYVRGLFEALDLHGEKRSVRDIVLSILEIILSRRDICIIGDHDFHNLLRIIYKILSSEKFRLHEFPAVAQMFSAITRRFASDDPIPLIPVSKATGVIVECAGKHLSKCLDENAHSLRYDVVKLLKSVYTTIRAYLELLGRFAIDRSSDLLFPLYDNDDPQMHSRSYHKNCQIKCLDFAYKRLFPPTIRHLKTVDKLDTLDRSLILGFFETLRETILSASRVEHNEFIDYVMKEDCLSLAHSFSYKCTDADLRAAVKSFLKAYVLHHIGTKFEPDLGFKKFAAQQDIVETNHKNAILYSRDQAKSSRTIFYVMVSYIAYVQKSRYYNHVRLKKVISEVDPALFFASKSKVIVIAYLHAASTVLRSVSVVEDIEEFFVKYWNQMRDNIKDSSFDEEFCSHEKIFLWAHRHPAFKKLITWRSIKRLVEIGFSRISIAHNMLRLLNDEFYKEQIIKYMENEESSVELIERFTGTIDGCEFHVGDRYHKPLMAKLGAIIPTLLYDAFQKLINDLDNTENIAKTKRLIKMILLWIDHYRQLNLLLDHDFISAWFNVLDEITIRRLQNNEKFENLIILSLQFICALIESNHSQLISILARLNYTSLGLMYTWLTNYTIRDILAEKVATMIMVYDELDYPLKHDAVNGLLDMKPNILNWMLSGNNELHALSIRCIGKTFKSQQSKTTRVLIATGLINMIAQNPEILKIKEHVDILRLVVLEDEIVYNPLLSRVKDLVPNDLIASLSDDFAVQVSPSPSPALSFDSDESDLLEEENISVMRILTQLQNEETPDADTSCTIPDSLYISRALIDRHINSVDIGDWERLASESNRNREQSV